MRKELKSKSRRKWLLGGSLAFASVALLTTGFATWVIGTRQTSGDGKVNIGVDTAKDNSVELTFSLDDTDNKIFVAEDAGNSNSNLTIERDEKEADTKPDWSIKIKDLVTDDKVGVRTGLSSWNYIELAKSKFDVTLPASYPAGGKIYDINDTPNNPDKTFSFNWGSYFGEKAPSDFYKEKEGSKGGQTLREYYQKALQELQAMKTALNGGELTLTAIFEYGQTTVGK